MVLEVTARDDQGNELYRKSRTWQEIGVDAERRMRYGAWLIKEIIDLSLPPRAIQREQFVIHLSQPVSEVSVQTVLRYHLGAGPGETVTSLSRTLMFDNLAE